MKVVRRKERSFHAQTWHSWWLRSYDLRYIIELVIGQERKELEENRDTSDKKGSSTHQERGDLTSSNTLLTKGSLLKNSSR